MRRRLQWIGVAMVALAGCRAPSTGVEPGADSSELAVAQFLGAARSEDLQAISAVWGNDVAPARDRLDRRELEQRLLIFTVCLRHDASRIGLARRGENGRTVHDVEMTQGEKNATVAFTTIRNTRSGRWYVEEFDLEAARPFCARSSGGGHGA